MMRPTILLVPKQLINITVPFRRESYSLMLKWILKLTTSETFYTPQLIIEKLRYSGERLCNILLRLLIYMYMRKQGGTVVIFRYGWLDSFKWLQKPMNFDGHILSQDKQISSSIAKHLIKTGYDFDTEVYWSLGCVLKNILF